MNPFLRPGEHWDPYAREWRKNLTEAEVQNLWPYNKDVSVVEPIHDWLEETLQAAGLDKTQPDTLTAPPPRADRFPPKWSGGCTHCNWGDKDCVCPGATGAPPSKADQEKLAAEVANMLVMADALGDDNVHLPKHYARYKIEPVRFCIENNLNGFQFNIIKYILRHDAKNGLEDLRKARRYLDMFILWVEGNEDWWK